jgi:hypothetical protein
MSISPNLATVGARSSHTVQRRNWQILRQKTVLISGTGQSDPSGHSTKEIGTSPPSNPVMLQVSLSEPTIKTTTKVQPPGTLQHVLLQAPRNRKGNSLNLDSHSRRKCARLKIQTANVKPVMPHARDRAHQVLPILNYLPHSRRQVLGSQEGVQVRCRYLRHWP